MWGFLLRFLSGRMLAGFAAISLVGLLASGLFWLRSVERKAAAQEILVQTLQNELASTREQLQRERRRREETMKLLSSMGAKLREIRSRYSANFSRLKDVPDEGCLDRPVPAAVDRLLGG